MAYGAHGVYVTARDACEGDMVAGSHAMGAAALAPAL